MALSITNTLLAKGDASYYTEGWRLLIETHLPNIMADANNRYQVIDPIDAYRFAGDFDGLCQTLQPPIPPQYRFIVMRMNGMRSPGEFKASMTQILMPSSFQSIEKLRSKYNTTTN